jgi:TonB-dependent starch-binding outer membrane protein SusC
MKWAKRLLGVAVLVAVSGSVRPVLAQATGRVAVTVTDSVSAQPLAGATVVIVGTRFGGQTGTDGRITVNNVPTGAHQVRIQRIGYAPRTLTTAVEAGQTANIAVSLRTQTVQLDTVVAVGYGTQSRRNVTGSVSIVTTDALDKAPIGTIDQVLQGTSPGVQVTSSSGEPGGAMSVRIRGTSSITGNSEPLYVVDGFPIENDIEGSSVGNGGRDRTAPPNPLVTLNPSDIESISILKDASATAIYGARGANGVVIVTTKQGRGVRPAFTIDSYTGYQEIAKKYKLLDAAGYMNYANTFAQNSSQAYTPFPDSTKARLLASGVNTDWQDELFRQGGVRNVQLSVRGATSAAQPTRYSLSAGAFDQDGIVLGSGLRRYSARLNLDQQVGTRFEFAGTVSASQARTKSVPSSGQQNGNSGAISAALQYVPIMPVKRPDGTYSYINTDLNAYNSLLDAPQTPNPISLANEVLDSLSDTRLLTNFWGQADLTRDLKLKVAVGADYANRWRNTYYPRTTLRGSQSNGEAIRATANTSSWLNENTLTYRHTFRNVHDVDLLGGYSRQSTNVDGANMENTNFVSDITGYFDIGAGTQTGGPGVSSRRTTQTLESWLSRLNYSLLDRYLLTLTYRADGSSRFAVNKKWGAFPSAGLAWRASSEPWFRVGGIEDLKFRLTYGLVGNPSIRPYQSLARLNNQTYSFGGTAYSGYYAEAVGNPNLTWETTRQTDAGVDVAFMDRFNFTADYYTKRTTNLLLQISLPNETGFQTALANRGSVENKGWEAGLDAQIIKGGSANAFAWKANVNMARNRNKVLDLGGQTSIFANFITTDYNLPGTMIIVGQPVGVFYGFKSLGIIRDSAAAAAVKYTNFNGSTYKAGDMLAADIAGAKTAAGRDTSDGKITLEDRTVIGDPTPDFNYGITNTLSFRGFELTGLLQGVHGGKILNVNRIRTESSPRVNVAADRYYDAWSPTNTDAKYPRIGENPNQVGTNNFTTNLLEDASYLRLRTVTLSWAVPRRYLMRSGVDGARVYFTGSNLITWSDYSGFDPDVSAQSVGNTNRGIDIGAYPLARTFTAGLSFNF